MRYKPNRRKPDLVYFATRRNSTHRDVKIGITVDLPRRMAAIRGDLIFAFPCSQPRARDVEFALHKSFEKWRVEGTEWFTKNDSLWMLISGALRLGYWPWDHTTIIRGKNW